MAEQRYPIYDASPTLKLVRKALGRNTNYKKILTSELNKVETKMEEASEVPQMIPGSSEVDTSTYYKRAHTHQQPHAITEHKYQSYEPHVESSSEFEDLVNAISELKSNIVSYLEELNSLYGRFTQATSGTKEECDTEARMSKIAADMGRQYQQIDRHYGWVLATDHTLVNEVLRSRFGGKIDGKTWSKSTIEELKATRRLLVESAQRAF